MRAAILFVVLVSVQVHSGRKQQTPVCSVCPSSTLPCDSLVSLNRTNCVCQVCITKCSVRNNPCNSGYVCNEVSANFSKIVKVAQCDPFEECPDLECDVDCPVSGFFLDKNNCATCICNDPCAEVTSISSYEEAEYECLPMIVSGDPTK